MSWIEQNYEKVAVGIGALGLLSCIGIVGLKTDEYEKKVGTSNPRKPKMVHNDTADRLESAIQSISTKKEIEPIVDEKSQLKRELSLFLSVDRYLKTGGTDVMDLGAPNSKNVHPEIPNEWFFNHDLLDRIGSKNVVHDDDDGDGFSNLEEYKAKTDPKDMKSFPGLLVKLEAQSVQNDQYQISYTEGAGTQVNLKVVDRRFGSSGRKRDVTGTRLSKRDMNAGDWAFDEEGRFFERFQYVGRKKMNIKKGEMTIQQDAIIVKDLKYTDIPDRDTVTIPRNDEPDWDEYNVKLVLNAIGQNGAPRSIDIYQPFGLPLTSTVKKYKISAITPLAGSTNKYDITIIDIESGETVREFKNIEGTVHNL